ncbi:MAG: AbrB/MazE/SpoVT family DNA-binding domain-containing protein [Ruminococcus flavefaciens]|nr:AbrB/MazE/SpoVT family DNA-binding domain-containing protein [Ruminococcus flavefaciens]MCM1228558.1 AbrB/MazE/SpoVT family DNA-binding domain-containing protein [Ruminococcus flavefaciens]
MNTTAVIQKWGNSQGIRIPKYILQEINWSTDDILDIEIQGNTIVLKKNADYPVIDLAKRFEEYHGEIPQGEYDWGEPQGEEIW